METYLKEKWCLVFSSEEIMEYLVTPLLNNPLLSVTTEMDGEERAKDNIERNEKFSSARKRLSHLSDEEYLKHMLEEYSKDNPYFRREQITNVYFQDPEISENEEDWFYIGFFADYIAKLFALNETFVFADERVRNSGASETYGELVYEGQLHGRPPAEILTVMRELAEILAGAKKLDRQNFDIPQRECVEEKQYGYRIDLYYPKGLKPEMSERVLDNYHFYFHDLP